MSFLGFMSMGVDLAFVLERQLHALVVLCGAFICTFLSPVEADHSNGSSLAWCNIFAIN
jgi:hypothetical protein